MYIEYILMRALLENWYGGVTMGGREFSYLRFGDDTIINTEKLDKLIKVSKENAH